MALQRTRMGLHVYSRTMGTSMKALFEQHVDQISKNPQIDVEKIRSNKYLHEFDRDVQGPTWGYPTEGAYYRDASSTDSLFNIKIPLFAIHAEDDPVGSETKFYTPELMRMKIAVREALPFQEIQQTPYAVLCTTSLGGHLSWFELGGNRWFAKPASKFLMRMADDISLEKPAQAANGHVGEEAKLNETAPKFLPMRRKLQMHMDMPR